MDIILAIYIFLMPALILFICNRFKRIGAIGPILIAYIVGIILANVGITLSEDVSMNLSQVAIPVALPLLLFGTQFKLWLKMCKETVTAFFLAMIAAFVSSLTVSIFFSTMFDEAWKIGGMLAGVYTGGTTNLISIGTGLKIDNELLVMVNSADVIVGGLFFLFFVTIAKPIFKKVLKPTKTDNVSIDFVETDFESKRKLKDVSIKEVLVVLALAICIAGVSVLLSMILFSEIVLWFVILMITSISIILSFVERIQKIQVSYDLGNYLLLVFAVAIGTTVHFKEMFGKELKIVLYVFLVVLIAIIIHLILSRIFNISVDTMIITSIAGVFGPVFVLPVAKAIKNKSMILSGITSGLVGYAAGNYVGFLCAYLLKILLH